MSIRLWIPFALLLTVMVAVPFALRRNSGEVNPKPVLVQSERDFILGMIPHHEEAVDSSQKLLTIAVDGEVRGLAVEVVAAQQAEITKMKAWYELWYGSPYTADGRYASMMRPLTNLSSRDAEARWVSDMITHHEHAVQMARETLVFAKRPELLEISTAIIATQSAEIAKLQTWLREKYNLTPQSVDHSMH